MTDNDNKAPQITADYKVPEGYTLVLSWLYEDYKTKAQQADQLQAEFKQLRAERAWQDISTAPKDGTKILAYLIDNAEHRKSFPENERNGIDIIVWTNHNKGGWISNRFGTPTHWMPLPDKSKLIDASSSKGRTPDFDSGNCGSNPQEAAKLTDSAQSE